MHVSLIAAQDENRVIGGDNKLLWHIPEDLKFFKATTMGKPVIMGRKTYESIGRPLPKRTNIVITRQPGWTAEGVTVVHGVPEALEVAKGLATDEIMVIGGAQIYEQALQSATRVYLTQVHGAFKGEAVFPLLDPATWKLVSHKTGEACAEAGINYDFTIYEKV